MQMRKHFDCSIPRRHFDIPFHDRQKTSRLMDVAGWNRHTSRRLALPRRTVYVDAKRTNNAEAESKQIKFVIPRHFGFLMAAMSNITEVKC